MTARTSFPSAYDLSAPAGAEQWRDLYPYYLMFADNRRAEEDGKFWFCDSQHWAEPVQALRCGDGRVRCQVPRPVQYAPLSCAAGKRRRFPHPQRLFYMSPVGVAPPTSARAFRSSWTVPDIISATGTIFSTTG